MDEAAAAPMPTVGSGAALVVARSIVGSELGRAACGVGFDVLATVEQHLLNFCAAGSV